jgi:hypothetical protein
MRCHIAPNDVADQSFMGVASIIPMRPLRTRAVAVVKSGYAVLRQVGPIRLFDEYGGKLWGRSAEASANPRMGKFSARCGDFTLFLVARRGLGFWPNG